MRFVISGIGPVGEGEGWGGVGRGGEGYLTEPVGGVLRTPYMVP